MIFKTFFLIFLLFLSGIFEQTSGSTLTGEISAVKGCEKDGQLWLSIKKELLYQLDIKVGSTFEFNLKPGKYQIVATNKDGCYVKSDIFIKKIKGKHVKFMSGINLRLAPI